MAEQRIIAVFSRCQMDMFQRKGRNERRHAINYECRTFAEPVADLDPYLKEGWRVKEIVPLVSANTLGTTYFVLERNE